MVVGALNHAEKEFYLRCCCGVVYKTTSGLLLKVSLGSNNEAEKPKSDLPGGGRADMGPFLREIQDKPPMSPLQLQSGTFSVPVTPGYQL